MRELFKSKKMYGIQYKRMTILKSLAESFLFFAIKLRRRLQLREQWKKTRTLSFFSPPSFPWLSGTETWEAFRRFFLFCYFLPFFCQSRASLCFFSRSVTSCSNSAAPLPHASRLSMHNTTVPQCEMRKWNGGISFPAQTDGEEKKEFSARRCGKSGDADLSKVQQREEKKGGGKNV